MRTLLISTSAETIAACFYTLVENRFYLSALITHWKRKPARKIESRAKTGVLSNIFAAKGARGVFVAPKWSHGCVLYIMCFGVSREGGLNFAPRQKAGALGESTLRGAIKLKREHQILW